MARTISVSEARAGLPQILAQVTEGEEVTITRHGKAVAVVVRPDVLKVRRAEGAWDTAVTIRDLLTDAGRRALTSGPVLSNERAEQLVEDVRASRADR